MNLLDYMEDFDNSDLPYEEWVEQLIDAVKTYNDEYNTIHDPLTALYKYINKTRTLDQ